MLPIYVLLIAYLLYLFFGAIVDKIIGSNDSNLFLRIKTKICFHTFVAPIMFGVVMFYLLSTDDKVSNILFGCMIVLGCVIRISFTNRRYLAAFDAGNGLLSIKYLTPFLKVHSTTFNLEEVSNFEIAKGNWLVEYPASVSFKNRTEWKTFEIIDRALNGIIHTNIDGAKKIPA